MYNKGKGLLLFVLIAKKRERIVPITATSVDSACCSASVAKEWGWDVAARTVED